MTNNRFRQLLNDKKPTVSTRLWSTLPFYTEVVGNTNNFDYIEFVAEYSPFSQYDMENIVRAAELHNMGSMIKVDFQNRGYVSQKAIASGFQAINFADHHTADEVRESLSMIRPDKLNQGRFGFPNRRYIGGENVYCNQMYHAERLNDVVACFMIEKVDAINNIDEICSVPGVDMVQFGPSDFAMSSGRNRQDYINECKEAEKKMIESALKHGVQPRCEIQSAQEADYYISLGVSHFSLGDQMKVLMKYWDSEGSIMRNLANSI